MPNDLKLFVDTMVFLHYRPLDELKLFEQFGAKSITIVVPQITWRELDKNKSGKTRKIQDRARRALNDLSTALDTGKPLKGNFQVEEFSIHPKEILEEAQFDSTRGDDVLVASILAYRTLHPETRVALITQDTYPRRLCKRNGLESEEPSASLRYEDEMDPIEKENRDLKKQLDEIASAMPRLTVGLSAEGASFQSMLVKIKKAPVIDENFLDELKRRLTQKYPHIHAQRPPETDMVSQWGLVTSFHHIPEAQIDLYNQEVDLFILEFIAYERSRLADTSKLRTFVAGIEIANVGTSPAEDVTATFTFPTELSLSLKQPSGDAEAPPNPPEKPRNLFDDIARPRLLRDSLIRTNLMPISPRAPIAQAANVSSQIEQRKDAVALIIDIKRVKQHTTEGVPKLFIQFGSYTDVRSFTAHFNLVSATLPRPISGELHFNVELEPSEECPRLDD